MRKSRHVLALALVALLAVPAAAQITPEVLAKLEAKRQANPTSVPAMRSLGIALFKLKRYTEAEAILADAQKASPKDAVVALYRGMSAEERGDLAAARAAYTTYLATGRTKPAKDAVNQRLAAVAQQELDASAKAAVARERTIGAQAGPDRTIAIMPLSVTGDPMYEPLGRGLADLMISDFGKVPGLTLLERDRIQAILDEIALGQSNRVDPTTATRSGRLLQAGRVVTGSVNASSQANVQLATRVVSVGTTASTPGGSQSAPMNNLFTAEKLLVLQTLAAMNIQISPEVRASIDANIPTRNIQAFLAYSNGLVASDAGRLDEATRFFDNARAIDPGFSAATQAAAQARAGQAGASVTTAQIETALRGSGEGQIVAAAERGVVSAGGTDILGSTLQNTLADVNPSAADAIGRGSTSASTRDAASAATGNDGATIRVGTLTIVIKRP